MRETSVTPIFNLNLDAWDFQRTMINTEKTREFTITNYGGGTLNISDISISGDYFSLVNNPASIGLGVGQSARFSVKYAPTAVGNHTGTVSITYGRASATITLAGEGFDTRITQFPWTENFDAENAIPAYWTVVNVDGGGTTWEPSTSYAHSSTRALKHGYSYDGNQEGWLITPPIGVPPKADGKLTFKWWNYCGSPSFIVSNTLCINTTNDPNDGNWVELWNYENPTASWREDSVNLEAYADKTVYLAFIYEGYDGNDWYIDDLSLEFSYDFPQGDPITMGEGEDAITITMDQGAANYIEGGDIPPVGNAAFVQTNGFVLALMGDGPWIIRIETTAPWGAFYRYGSWTSVENTSGTEIVFDIPAAKGAKAGEEVAIVLGDDDPTLPITLSSFTAVLTADLHVKIAWIAESETEHAGYNLLRGEVDNLQTAIHINRELITDGNENGSQIAYSYTDSEVYPANTYYYWLESQSLNGETDYYGPLQVQILAQDEEQELPVIPMETKLLSAFPNPFNPTTNLRYSMKEAGEATIQVYNVKGQLLKTFHNRHDAPGYYQLSWDGRDAQGKALSTGVYFYRMTSGKYSATKKMVLSK